MRSVFHFTQHKGSWYVPLIDYNAGSLGQDVAVASAAAEEGEEGRGLRWALEKAAQLLPKTVSFREVESGRYLCER